jgi:broad specificity phosphatase PhoE
LTQDWPRTLWIVRHGQSAGNVARDAAEAAGLFTIDIAERDIDVPLSELGHEQAQALGLWFGSLSADRKPEVVLTSPYVRLREQEFGLLDRLTVHGIRQKYPELAAQRVHVGKFYFRPPGGESWCDVILRLRSVLEMVSREHAGQRVLVVAHQVIVNCMRYLMENLEEHEILALDRRGDVPNCGVTSYERDPEGEGMRVDLVNFVAPLRRAGAPVTVEPDALAAPKP